MANKVIHNKRPQKVTVALLDDDGKPVSRVLKPYEQTEPIPEEKIGAYTHRMAALKKVRIRKAV